MNDLLKYGLLGAAAYYILVQLGYIGGTTTTATTTTTPQATQDPATGTTTPVTVTAPAGTTTATTTNNSPVGLNPSDNPMAYALATWAAQNGAQQWNIDQWNFGLMQVASKTGPDYANLVNPTFARTDLLDLTTYLAVYYGAGLSGLGYVDPAYAAIRAGGVSRYERARKRYIQ